MPPADRTAQQQPRTGRDTHSTLHAPSGDCPVRTRDYHAV